MDIKRRVAIRRAQLEEQAVRAQEVAQRNAALSQEAAQREAARRFDSAMKLKSSESHTEDKSDLQNDTTNQERVDELLVREEFEKLISEKSKDEMTGCQSVILLGLLASAVIMLFVTFPIGIALFIAAAIYAAIISSNNKNKVRAKLSGADPLQPPDDVKDG